MCLHPLAASTQRMPSREHLTRQLVGSRARGSVGCAISCFPGAPLLAPSHRSLSAGSSAVDTATAAAAARRVGKRPAGPDCTLQNQRRRLNDGASTTSTSPRRQLTLQQAVPPPGLPAIRAGAPAEPSDGLQVDPDGEDGSGGEGEPEAPHPAPRPATGSAQRCRGAAPTPLGSVDDSRRLATRHPGHSTLVTRWQSA